MGKFLILYKLKTDTLTHTQFVVGIDTEDAVETLQEMEPDVDCVLRVTKTANIQV